MPGAALEVELPVPLPPRRALADRAGRFRLDGLPAGTAVLRARDAEQALGLHAMLELEPGAERAVELALGAAATLRGRVVDAGGAGLAGRRLVLEEQGVAWERLRAPWSGDPARLRTTLSAADGSFAFVGLAPLAYELRAVEGADPTGAVLAVLRDQRPGGDPCRLALPAGRRPGSVTGLVAAREPIPSGTFLALRGRAETRELRLAVDPASGRFDGESIQAGDHVARLFLSGRPVYEVGRIRVQEGQRLDLGTIALPAPGALELVLRDESGRPVEDAEVVLVGQGICQNTAVDAGGVQPGGRVGFGALWPGDYELTVFAPGRIDRRLAASVHAGQTCTLELRLAPGIALELGVRAAHALAPGAKLDLEIEQASEVIYRVHADPAPDAQHLFLDRVTLAPGPAHLAAWTAPERRVELDLDVGLIGSGARVEIDLPEAGVMASGR